MINLLHRVANSIHAVVKQFLYWLQAHKESIDRQPTKYTLFDNSAVIAMVILSDPNVVSQGLYTCVGGYHNAN
ncbi:MAG: hypothetical protein KTR17_12345 [Cellvibrionaceae bacterium]|nr:hypothetical protein [Cellvibrionaceae bacterium]